jgi:hypothetical protein
LFKVRNFYRFNLHQENKKPKVYSLQHKYLEKIFNSFPDFKSLIKIRALRRQHYYKKLRE